MSETIRVMLIDDEKAYARTLAKRLARRDVLVSLAFSGAQAVARLGASPVDVVVLDMKMPGLDGLQVLKAIKHEYPDAEVVMLTGNADMDEAMEAMTSGAFDYLTKPVNLELLQSRISDAAKSANLRQQRDNRQMAC